MQENPGNFQAIAVWNKTFADLESFPVAGNNISCKEAVKLLGIEFDYQLTFSEQV